MLVDDDDRTLVYNCLHGDCGAFDKIVEKYQKPLFNVALRITSRREVAEDVTQTSFLKAYENLKGYNPKKKLFSWLYRIAINEALNTRKSQRSNEECGDDVRSEDQRPDEIIQDSQRKQTIERAVKSLSTDYSVVILLRHFQNLSYQEMSEVLQIPEKTVKSRLFSARQQLRNILMNTDIA